MKRRQFLAGTAGLGGMVLLAPGMLAAQPANGPYGPLGSPDANGLRLPAGFQSRVVAQTGQAVSGTSHVWHAAPDGGATFPMSDGGWVYVSNAELDNGAGGVSMIRFDPSAAIVGAGTILSGTSMNCAGGAMPWGTWLSCEEWRRGSVWECDPLGLSPAQERPGLGLFQHEAAAADPVRQVIYLTEDRSDGCLYRFVPNTWGDLSSGTLEVMTEVSGQLGWAVIPDPSASPQSTRYQVSTAKHFSGGEGAWYDDNNLYFTTKGDNRVWRYDAAANTLEIIYDQATSPTPVLSGVDNITVSPAGDLFVCEDGGNMEVVLLSTEGEVAPFLQSSVTGSELAGVAFDPSGTRLYVSSQRNPGTTWEITGPFRTGSTVVGGRVSDADGSAEPGVVIDLFADVDPGGSGIRGTWLGSTTTGVDGTYEFEVEAGCFVVTQIAPTDRLFDNGTGYNQIAVCVADGEQNRAVGGQLLGGADQTATLGGRISFADQTPVQDVSVDLFEAAADGSRGQWLRSITTGPDGRYEFVVPPACYVITQIAPAGEGFLPGGGQYNQVGLCVEAGDVSDDLDGILAGQLAPSASLGGTVTEPPGVGVPGVKADLFEAAADGSRGPWLGDATTGPDGSYQFDAQTGCYIVVLIAPAGRTFVNGTGFNQLARCLSSGDVVDDLDGGLS